MSAGRRAVGVAGVVLAAGGVARADHDHAGHAGPDDGSAAFTAALSVVGARYDNPLYVGNYQGVTPSLGWAMGRFGAQASLTFYRLDANGRVVYGPGDTMLGGHAALVTGETVVAGVGLHLMFPTGSEVDDLGMGHVMAMPNLWTSWRADALTLSASAGYGRALASTSGHNHGPMPVVDPMNMQELTWRAGVGYALGGGLAVGADTHGAAPLGTGRTRAAAGAHLAWAQPRVTTSITVLAGLAGDPYTVRGLLETAVRF